MEKPTYEELEKKIKRLETQHQLTQVSIARFLQKTSTLTLELISGTSLPLKIENYFGHPSETLDWENPNIDYMKGVFIKVIGAVD